MKERNEGQKVTKDTKVTWPKGYEGYEGYMAKRLRRLHFFSNAFCDIVVSEIAIQIEPQLFISAALIFHVRYIILVIKLHHLLYEFRCALSKRRARRVFEKLVLK